MAGLKGLDAQSVASRKEKISSPELAAFINAAPVKAKDAENAPEKKAGRKPKSVKPAKYTFSLTEAVNKDIDQLSLAPRSFKATRSDIIRAGVVALKAMPKKDLIALLATVVGAENGEGSANI